MKKEASLKQSLGTLITVLKQLQKYSLLAFIIFLAAIYGFVVFRIAAVSSETPSSAVVDEQVRSARVPKINDKVVEKIKSLQDNSESVQALFVEARNNPFQ